MARDRKLYMPALTTAGGRTISPFARGLHTVHLFDIARCLANLPYGHGHTPKFVSLAQFSILIARGLGPADARRALLWPAPTVYLGLEPSSAVAARHLGPDGHWHDYHRLYDCVLLAVYEHFGLPPLTRAEAALFSESNERAAQAIHRDIGPRLDPELLADADPYPETVTPLSPDEAYKAWLAAFRRNAI